MFLCQKKVLCCLVKRGSQFCSPLVLLHLYLTVPEDLPPDPPSPVPGGATGSRQETSIEGIAASGRGTCHERPVHKWALQCSTTALHCAKQYIVQQWETWE